MIGPLIGILVACVSLLGHVFGDSEGDSFFGKFEPALPSTAFPREDAAGSELLALEE